MPLNSSGTPRNPDIWEVEAGGTQGPPWLHRLLEASLGYSFQILID